MKVIISFVVVLIVCFSIGEAHSHKSHNKHHKPHHTNKHEEKIDLCPLIGKAECRRAPGANIHECVSDNDCKKNETKSNNAKCCLNGCQDRVCTKPVKISKKSKEGSCPLSTFDPLIMCSPVDPVFFECRQDSECSGKKKCCAEGPCGVLKCKDTVDERKGNCPEFKYNFTVIQNCKPFNASNFECRKDADCKNKAQKCCKNDCALLTCQNATAKKETGSPKDPKTPKEDTKEVKSGHCPVWTFDPLIQCTPVDPKYWDCREDKECNGTQKCCPDGPCAVKKCKAAVEMRKGDCPMHKFDNAEIKKCPIFSADNSKCKVDADCKEKTNQKCCRDACFNLTCQDPSATQKKSKKP